MRRRRRSRDPLTVAVVVVGAAALLTTCPSAEAEAPLPSHHQPGLQGRQYPVHTSIVATTFWVGEVFDPQASDGSQEISAYDDDWMASYGGCDGVVVDGICRTERRTATNDYFPTRMTPWQNPFYLDLPFDDVNDPTAATLRADVVPWAHDPGWRQKLADPRTSIMKNRWVAIRNGERVCYGQIQDAGPGRYDDAQYVFGSDDARPANTRYNGAGLDLSPALNGCLAFHELDGNTDHVDWPGSFIRPSVIVRTRLGGPPVRDSGTGV